MCVFGLHGFGYTRLGKIINIRKKKFIKRNQLYKIFGHAQASVDVEPKNCSLFT